MSEKVVSSTSAEHKESSEAAMAVHRFASPISHEDEFLEIPVHEDTVNLDLLIEQAEDSATKRAKHVSKTSKNHESSRDVSEKIADQVLALLTLSRYRRGPVRYIEQARLTFKNQILHSVRHDEPIRLIASFFGSKVQNPVKTWSQDGTEVDISEVGSILRFYEITQAIENIYPRGAEFHIACDGCKYAESIGFSEDAGRGYYEKVRAIAEYFDIQHNVHLFNESSLYPKNIQEQKERHLARVSTAYSQHDPATMEKVSRIRSSMCLAMPIAKTTPIETVRLAFSGLADGQLKKIDSDAYELRASIFSSSLQCAMKYVAHYDAVKESGVLESAVPNALRTTVHPKEGQIGIYAINQNSTSAFPHHGQGITKDGARQPELDKIRIGFRADIERSAPSAAVSLSPDHYPFASKNHPFTFVTDA